jgi:hypothetical protein
MAKHKKSKKSNKSKKKVEASMSGPNTNTVAPQTDSKLMQLPQEIRDTIYASLFESTRFVSGWRTTGPIEQRRLVSATVDALAILRSCRRINAEVGKQWLQQTTFVFEDPDSMLDKLADIPIALRSQIRHVRVSGDPLMLSYEEDDVYYRTYQVLELLPGLKLDTLTVLGCKGREVCYETLDRLIRYSDGWKELRFLSVSSVFLGYKDIMLSFGSDDSLNDRYLRQPQPGNWQKELEERDGSASHPSVVIYRSTDSTTPCAIQDSNKRDVFVQEFSAGQTARTYGKTEDSLLMRNNERWKEVLVVVKRGTGVDYSEKVRSPYSEEGAIRLDNYNKTWKEIKIEQDAMFKDDDDDEDWLRDQVLVDKYRNVDEYTWPPLHFH